MIVVPAFSETQDSAYRVIGGVLTGVVGSVPKDVTD